MGWQNQYWKERKAFHKAVEVVAESIVQSSQSLQSLEETRAIRSKRVHQQFMVNPHHHGKTPMRATVCPRKMFEYHPDADLRELADAQARESHRCWGPCKNVRWYGKNGLQMSYPASMVTLKKRR
jgi:hypothetical protein